MITADEIRTKGVNAVFGIYGDDATFTPAQGPPVSCRVIKFTEGAFQPTYAESRVMGSEIMIEYQRSEIDRFLVKGEYFTIGAVDYEVQNMADGSQGWNEKTGTAVVKVKS